jgi:hypothetical protein
MAQNLNETALGYSSALLGALSMLALGIFGNLGIYTGAVNTMQNMHVFFSLSIGGIITGMIEAAVWSFIAGWLIAYFYNKFQ